MFLVYNSDIYPENAFHLPINNRAFQYGDGLFETIRYERGQIWFWPDHVARLSAGMAALQLPPPSDFTADTLYQRLLHLISINELSDQTVRVKIQVWRQPGGLYTPTINEADWLITAQRGGVFSITEKVNAGVYADFRLAPSPISTFKTLNALPYVLAGLHKERSGLDEVILLDTEGHLAECLASNLFWLAGQTLYTPSLQTGCINGILRRQLLRLAPASGLTLVEGLYKPHVLAQADAVFCANVMGIQWLRRVQDLYDNPAGTRAETLLNALFAQLQG